MSSPIDPIRFGYVGCGFVAQSIHIPNFSALPGCRFLALAEPRGDLGNRVAKLYGIPKVYASHEEMASDPDIEAVGVSGPYALQGRIAEELLRAGKHVFMEKPMAVSTSRAESIVQAVRESGKRLMVGYMKRYDRGNLLLRSRLDAWRASGECGELIFARNHGFGGNWVYAQDPNIPVLQSDVPPPPTVDEFPEWLPPRFHDGYLGYLQQWTHNINLLRFLLGDDGGKSSVRHVDLGADGMTGLTVLGINGTRTVIESAYTKFHGWDEHTQIFFKGGWLRTEAPALMQKELPASVELYRAAHDEKPASLTREFADPSWAYREEAAHFLSCVRTGEPFRSSAEDTLHDVRLIEAIYRAHAGGQRI